MIQRYNDTIPDFSKGKIDHPETRLHLAVVDYLKGQIRSGKSVLQVIPPFPGLLFTAPTGEKKDKKEAFWAKRKGYKSGTPDLVLWERINGISTMMAIELKAKDGTQSGEQKEFQQAFEAKGGLYAICRKVSEVRDTLKSWGLICKVEFCIEPAPSLADKYKFAWEAQRP